MHKTITVPPESAGQRLDIFLAQAITQTRSQVKKMISTGLVTVNKKAPSVHQFLKANDSIGLASLTMPPAKPVLRRVGGKAVRRIEPTVVAEEKDYVIINKPAGMLAHATVRHEKDTLVDWLQQKYPEISAIGEHPGRPGLVHRLDKDVSGLMIVPRNKKAFAYFKKQFQERLIHKEYLALVYGRVQRDDVTITFPLARSKKGTFVARAKADLDTREAETRFHIEKPFINFTLLRVFPITGRTNQIRIHLTAYGNPIVGDRLYTSRTNRKSELPRIFLHATKINFTAPNGNEQTYDAPLPSALKTFLASAK